MLREATTNSSGHAKCVLLARVNEVGLPPQKKKIFFWGRGAQARSCGRVTVRQRGKDQVAERPAVGHVGGDRCL